MKNHIVSFLLILLVTSCATTEKSHIIAHRGYWNIEGSYANTLSSLRNAIKLKVYGSECDVRNTFDNVLVLHHDASLKNGGPKIEEITYDSLCSYKLPNGEKIPTLEEALEVLSEAPSKFRLIIEVKKGNVSDIVDMVEKHKMQKKVEYIAFDRKHCLDLLALNKGLKVSLLASDEKSAMTPAELKEKGFYGLDYYSPLLMRNVEWISEAKKLKLDVNVWTVNKKDEINELLKKGADKVTTDIPDAFSK